MNIEKEEKKENKYEILFITKKSDEEKFQDFKSRLENSAEIKNFEMKKWKEINPAYKIKDIEESEKALYFLVNFNCQKKQIPAVESFLNSILEIRRHRTINLTKDEKKMKIGKIRTPRPKVKKRDGFFRERKDQERQRSFNPTKQNV